MLVEVRAPQLNEDALWSRLTANRYFGWLWKLCLPSPSNVIKIIRWLTNEGAMVEKDEPILEVESAILAYEINAPVSGVIVEILVGTGALVKEGELLASIRT